MNDYPSVRPSVRLSVCRTTASWNAACCHISKRIEAKVINFILLRMPQRIKHGRDECQRERGKDESREQVEGQNNKKTTTAIHTQTAVTGMKWHYCYLNAASECFSSGVGPRQSGWHSRSRSRSRSAVARQLPHGSCHLAVVGCRLPNCQVESRFPHVRTGKGNGNSKGNGNGNYTKDVLK